MECLRPWTTSMDLLGLKPIPSLDRSLSGFNHGLAGGRDSCLHTDGSHLYIAARQKALSFTLRSSTKAMWTAFVLQVLVRQVSPMRQRFTVRLERCLYTTD